MTKPFFPTREEFLAALAPELGLFRGRPRLWAVCGALTLILPMNLATRTISIRYRGDLNSKKITSKQILRLTVKDGKGKVIFKAPPKKRKTLA